MEEPGVATSESGSKPTLEERIKQQSVAMILGEAVLVLVVSLVVGLGVGYKVEHDRTKNDVNKARAQARAQAQAKTKAQASRSSGASIRLVGKVGSTTSNSVTITVGGKTQRFLTNPTTIVVKATAGTAADITKGARVVWKPVSGQRTQAEEIIVLPANAKLGVLLLDTTADSMTFKSNGKNVTVRTKGAVVEKVTSATTSDIATGVKVLAQARHTNLGTLAVEIIVLPTTSKFVA